MYMGRLNDVAALYIRQREERKVSMSGERLTRMTRFREVDNLNNIPAPSATGLLQIGRIFLNSKLYPVIIC